jgi:hypothetical protein
MDLRAVNIHHLLALVLFSMHYAAVLHTVCNVERKRAPCICDNRILHGVDVEDVWPQGKCGIIIM